MKQTKRAAQESADAEITRLALEKAELEKDFQLQQAKAFAYRKTAELLAHLTLFEIEARLLKELSISVRQKWNSWILNGPDGHIGTYNNEDEFRLVALDLLSGTDITITEVHKNTGLAGPRDVPKLFGKDGFFDPSQGLARIFWKKDLGAGILFYFITKLILLIFTSPETSLLFVNLVSVPATIYMMAAMLATWRAAKVYNGPNQWKVLAQGVTLIRAILLAIFRIFLPFAIMLQS